jgi:hypothetical protein
VELLYSLLARRVNRQRRGAAKATAGSEAWRAGISDISIRAALAVSISLTTVKRQ